jgi:hypothetical protein
MPMEYLVPNDFNDDPSPGRTLHLEQLRRAEPGWSGPAWAGESVVRREGDVEDEEMRAAKEWLAHVEAGRIG